MKNYVDNGTTINYRNSGGTTIPSGRVLKIGNMLGAALTDIAPGADGAVQVAGKIRAPKVSGAVFVQGEKLIFDVSAGSGVGAFDDSAATPATGDLTGGAVAAEAGTNGQTECVVILTPGNTDVA